MEFVFESAGERLISRKLERFADRGVDAKPAFEAIADTLRGYEERLFDTQGASGGMRWADIADATKAAKAAHDPPLDPRVLHATLALRKSLTVKGDPEHEEVATADFLLFGSKLERAGFHQKGRGVPQRRPLQFTETQKRFALKQLQRFLVTGEV